MYKCRACLIKCEQDHIASMDLFDKLPTTSEDVTIADALTKIACICIADDPSLPSKICSSCCYRLLDAYMFIKRVQESATIISHHYVVPLVEASAYDENPAVKQEWEETDDRQDCLQAVQISSIQGRTDIAIEYQHDENCGDGGEEGECLIDEADIKKEPELDIEQENHQEEATYDDANYMMEPNDDLPVGIEKCACRRFHKADYVSESMRRSIRDRVGSMSLNDIRKLVESLIYFCTCGGSPPLNKDTSVSVNNSDRQLPLVAIFTFDCNGVNISVDKETFLDVFTGIEGNPLIGRVIDTYIDQHVYKLKKSLHKIYNNEILPNIAQPIIQRKIYTHKPQTCILCGENFKNLASLKRHVIIFHSYANEKREEDSLLQEIKKMKIKRNIKRLCLPCGICPRIFERTAALTVHRKFCIKRNAAMIFKSSTAMLQQSMNHS